MATPLKCECGVEIDPQSIRRSFKWKSYWVSDYTNGIMLIGGESGKRVAEVACNEHLTDNMKSARGGFIDTKKVEIRRPSIRRKV